MLNEIFLNKSLFLFLFLFLILINLLNCNPRDKQPVAKHGVIDLRSWNFQESKSIQQESLASLVGEWEFYWNVLIENPEDQKEFFEKAKAKVQYVNVPSEWQNYQMDGKFLPSNGYAMYKLKILFPKGLPPIAFYLTDFCISYQLYINGKLQYQAGKVGKSISEMEPLLRYGSFVLAGDSPEEMEIVVLISNFHHPKSGMWNKIMVGSVEQIEAFKKKELIAKVMTLGGLLIMGVYHIFLYFFKRKDNTPLFFGIFCILMFVRSLSMEDRIIMDIFSSYSFLTIYKLEYITTYLALPAFLFYTSGLFPKDFSKIFLYPVLFFCLFATLIAIFFPIEYYAGKMLLAFQFLILVCILYSTIVFILATIRKRDEAVFVLIGTLIFYMLLLNDILFGMGIIQSIHLSSYGVFIFTFFQSVVLSKMFSNSFKLTEIQAADLLDKTNLLSKSNLELTVLKTQLEKKVEERTASLTEAYKKNYTEIQKNYSLEKELAIQKERQKIFVDIHDHTGSSILDLKNTLNILARERTITEEILNKAFLYTNKIEDNLRLRMYAIEDLEILKSDPLNGIRLLTIRRYATYNREINFFCDEELYDISSEKFSSFFVEVLFSVAQENATNDLKYGFDLSQWRFLYRKSNGCICLEIKSPTTRNSNSHGAGLGRQNIFLRMKEVNGYVCYCEELDFFHARFYFPFA